MDPDYPGEVLTWKARNIQPVVILYVVGVFVAFMAVAHFVFHSTDGVKALFAAAIGSVVALIPNTLTRTEYRLTGAGLSKRPFQEKKQKPFKEVFAWDELSHMVPTTSGFKFYKRIETQSVFRRFLERHLLAGYSGEIHVEERGRRRVQAIFDRHAIPVAKPATSGRIGPGPGR